MHRVIWTLINLKNQEFRFIRYRFFCPQFSLDDIAEIEKETKAGIFKKIRKMCNINPIFKKMFGHYKLEE